MVEIPSEKGNYILVFHLEKRAKQYMHRFNVLDFGPGFYLYCGSAHGSGGIKSRIKRHQSRSSKKFWHIDFIKDRFHLREYWYQVSSEKNECVFSQFLANSKSGNIPIKGFGSSDCRNKCESHLIWFQKETNLDSMFNELNREFGGMIRIHA